MDSIPTAASAGYRMPAEWAPHERCWMAWPCRENLWVNGIARARDNYALVANTIANFEPVTMLARPQDVEACRRLCSDNVSILPVELDDSWARDTGPNFVVNDDGRLAASVFHFNAWGRKYRRWGKDAAVGHRIAEYLGIETFSSSLFMEGGGINVDGEGTVVTTEQCVLNENRNPGVTKDEAARILCGDLGIDKVLWCPGDPQDGETDGHIDGIACFIEPGKLLVETCPAKGSERYDLLQRNLEAFTGQTDASGRKLVVHTIEEAYEADRTSDIFCMSYINFYIANGAVIVPGYGLDRDQEALNTIAALFPDREAVQVDISDIAPGGGGIHCITQQQPVSAETVRN